MANIIETNLILGLYQASFIFFLAAATLATMMILEKLGIAKRRENKDQDTVYIFQRVRK